LSRASRIYSYAGGDGEDRPCSRTGHSNFKEMVFQRNLVKSPGTIFGGAYGRKKKRVE